MRADGVHTLYIQSGESSTTDAVLPDVGPWLVSAHQAGIKVVAWYLPHYSDVKLDVAVRARRVHPHRAGSVAERVVKQVSKCLADADVVDADAEFFQVLEHRVARSARGPCPDEHRTPAREV